MRIAAYQSRVWDQHPQSHFVDSMLLGLLWVFMAGKLMVPSDGVLTEYTRLMREDLEVDNTRNRSVLRVRQSCFVKEYFC